jgi:4-amino-4-deoxy-L-arabinose transferase-like glycosyltransferase
VKKKTLSYLLVIIILGALSVLFYHSTITRFPRATHAWSQSDRYALALNFQKNGYNFFLPETYCLNTSLPANKPLAVEKGITRVDFPVHDYAVSLIMKIIGSREPWVFRLYILIYSLTGSFFLFLLARKLTASFFAAIFVVVFAFTAPVITYYQDGFLPTIPSLANIFIGYYLYMRYRESRQIHLFVLAIVFFTLAALSRMPLIIMLLAIFFQHIFHYFKERKLNYQEMILFLFSFICIGGYFLYNVHLENEYGSGFLSTPMPANSWSDAVDVFRAIRVTWLFEYLTGWHYIVMLLTLSGSLFCLILRKKNNNIMRGPWLQLLIAFAGSGLYFILMLSMFKDHDYYFIDTFFPLIILAIIFLLGFFPLDNKKFLAFFLPITLAFSVLFVLSSMKVQEKRYRADPHSQYEASINDFRGSGKFLDSLGISRDAIIMVLNSNTQNIPLILMDRKGYSLFDFHPGELRKYSNRNWQYAVIQERMPVSDLLKKEPEITGTLERIAGNGKIAVYRRTPYTGPRSIEHFLGFDSDPDVLRDTLSFNGDSTAYTPSFKTFIINESPHSVPSCIYLSPGDKFFEVVNTSATHFTKGDRFRILLTAWIQPTADDKQFPVDLIGSLTCKDSITMYYSFNLGDYLDPADGNWQFCAFLFPFTLTQCVNTKARIYFWNFDETEFLIDDVAFTASPY